MDFSSVNWLAVVVCVIVSMISGSLWYQPEIVLSRLVEGIGQINEEPGMQGQWA